MTRSINATLLTDLAAATAEEIQFVELQFSDVTTRFCTAAWDISWNGLTWLAVGGRLDFEGFTESPEDSQNGMRLSMSGVDQALIAQILSADFIGRPAKVWHGHLNQSTGVVVGGATGPILMFDGRMNESWEINESIGEFGGGECVVTTKLAARISEIDKTRGIRTNPTSHQSCGITGVTTDTFFMNVAALVNKKVYWGQRAPSTGPPHGGPHGRDGQGPGGQGAPKTNPWGGGSGPRPPTTPSEHPGHPHG